MPIATCPICKENKSFTLVPVTHVDPKTQDIIVGALFLHFDGCGHEIFKLDFGEVNSLLDTVTGLSKKISELQKDIRLLKNKLQ